MAQEIELKLRLSPSVARRLLAHPVLVTLKPFKQRLFNTYYDTPELDLRKRGIALRMRRKGWATWVMTVKGGDSNAGGLAQRAEWEAPAQPGSFDFSIVTDDGLRDFLETHKPHLQAVFSTDFTRMAWTLERCGARLELALDRGKISAAGRNDEALCELELELLEGASADALFELAIELAADIPLHPEVLSKAERGYALVDGVLAQPVKGFVSPVNARMTPVDAFRAVALACVLQLQRNEAGAVSGQQPEFVHQGRVAIRRLRSAFKLFAPVLSPAFIEVYASRWRDLASGLGDARDWDVFLDETLAPLDEAFPGDPDLAVLRARGEATKAKAQALAGVALTGKDYSRLLLAFCAALFRVEPPSIGLSDADLKKFAARRLEQRSKAITKLVNEHGKMNAERRHDLRIDFKKLRYALEFFAPLLPRRKLSAYQLSLARIQDLLGTLNDQVTASRLIKEMHPKGENPLTRGWIAGRTQLLVVSLNEELRKLAGVAKPWR